MDIMELKIQSLKTFQPLLLEYQKIGLIVCLNNAQKKMEIKDL